MQEHFKQLTDYVLQLRYHGASEDQIRHTLLQANWDTQSIEQALAHTRSAIAPPAGPRHDYPSVTHQQHNHPATHRRSGNHTVKPKKYRVFEALIDSFKAMRHNAAAFITATLAGFGLIIVTFVVLTLLLGEVFGSVLAFGMSFGHALAVFIGGLSLYSIWYAFSGAFFMAVTSQALYEGAAKRKSHVGSMLTNGLKRSGRIAAANLLFATVVYWPIALLISIPLLLLLSGVVQSSGIIIMLISFIGAIAWALVALLRFSLVPYVAIFEPSVPIFKTLGRSKYLLAKGGQWFLIKGFLLFVMVIIIIGLATGSTLQELRQSGSLAVNIPLVIATIFTNGVLVMLYRNRRTIVG